MAIKIKNISFIFIITVLVVFSRLESSADTIYFKNGKSLEGRVKSDTGGKAVIETSFGDVECPSEQILKIKPGRVDEIRQAIERKYEWYGPNDIPLSVSTGSRGASVEVVLNNTVRAELEIDTGASIVVLPRKIGEALGVNLADDKKGIIRLQLADGKNAYAKAVMLESIKVGRMEEKDVMAAVLLEEGGDKSVKKGLLGMSFLNRFNMKIDLKEKKMTLIKMD